MELRDLTIEELKKRIKSRMGRIAELQIEVKIMDMLITQKLERGETQPIQRKPLKSNAQRRIKASKKPLKVINGDVKVRKKAEINPSHNHAFKEVD